MLKLMIKMFLEQHFSLNLNPFFKLLKIMGITSKNHSFKILAIC